MYISAGEPEQQIGNEAISYLELGHEGVIGQDAFTAAHKDLGDVRHCLHKGLGTLQLQQGWIHRAFHNWNAAQPH